MTAISASTPALERRRERRIPVHLPIVIRGTDLTGSSFEERTSSENLCRGGAAFATRYPLNLGIHLDIQFPGATASSGNASEFLTQGRIVHVKPGRSKDEIIVGVEFIGPRFNGILG